MNKYMNEAINKAFEGLNQKEGGPFGAVIVDENNNIIAVSNNTVLKDNDPTAHAEINAIRMASKKLNSYNLEKCTLYSTCEPCPMCLSAIIWSNIKNVYYGCNKEDAGNIGFRDDKIYDYLKNKDLNLLNLKNIDREEALKLFEKYEDIIY